MKTSIVFSILALTAVSLVAAETTPKDDVTSAAKALGDKASYSWKMTVAVPESSRFHPGPTEGKTEKGGYTWLSSSFQDNTSIGLVKGHLGYGAVNGSFAA